MASPESAVEGLQATLGYFRSTYAALASKAAEASRSSSSALFGMVGGIGGLGLVCAISALAPISLMVFAPLAGVAGVVAGVLVFRGRKRFDFERRLEMHRQATDEVLRHIKVLPKNAPTEVRVELWETYRRLIAAVPTQDSSSRMLPQKSQNALPAPTASGSA